MKLLIFLLLLSCGRSPFEKNTDITGSDPLKSEEKVEFTFYKAKEFLLLEENRFLAIFTENNKLLSDEFTLKAKLWMPTMNHGSYPITIKKLSPGVFQLEEVFFTMEGLWDLHLEIYKNDKLYAELKWSTTF